jgi:hypothetical protein
MLAHEREFVAGEGLSLAKSRRNDAVDAADGRLWLRGLIGLIRPLASDSVAKVEAFDGIGKVAHEVGAPEFAVSKDGKADLPLSLKHAENVAIFDLSKFRGGLARASRIEQFRGPKKAADVVSADW